LLALYDMANPRQALQEAIRTLRPGGSLVITEPRRTFQLQPLLDYGLAMLRAEGVYEELRNDWERIYNANRVLDPGRHDGPRRAEGILDVLGEARFDGLKVEASHLGQCATVWGTKPRR